MDHLLVLAWGLLEPWSNSKYKLILHNRDSIPVSRLYMKDVRKIFQLSK
ncbi:LytTR family transcriptional regulator DNA-binding domain-containing protein [Lysinibacillus sphaericus]